MKFQSKYVWLSCLTISLFTACQKEEKNKSAKVNPSSRASFPGMAEVQSAGTPETVKPNSKEGGSPADKAQISVKLEEATALRATPEWAEKRMDFYREWAKIAPEEALLHARTNNPGASTACVSAVLEGWSSKAPGAALSWVQSQPANAERTLWLGGLVPTWPEGKLDDLTTPIAENLGNPGGFQAAGQLAGKLIQKDPERALQWISESFTDAEQASRMTLGAMRDWASLDVEKASTWLVQAPSDAAWRDDAIEGLLEASVPLESAVARQWAQGLHDESRRQAALERIEKSAAAASAAQEQEAPKGNE